MAWSSGRTWLRKERRTETITAASVVSRKMMKKIGTEKYSDPMASLE